MAIVKIVAGGQTGADRGALDAARAWGISIGGWVPAGRLAEDGPIPQDYPMRETSTPDPAERTRLNVRDSDGTLIVSHASLHGGSRLTFDVALALGRPCLHVNLAAQTMAAAVDDASAWIANNGISILNVAGPRHSDDDEAYRDSLILVSALLARASATR